MHYCNRSPQLLIAKITPSPSPPTLPLRHASVYQHREVLAGGIEGGRRRGEGVDGRSFCWAYPDSRPINQRGGSNLAKCA